MPEGNSQIYRKQPWKNIVLGLGLFLFVSLDIIFFSNCIAPGDSQPPQILEKGEGTIGVSSHTGAIFYPIEIGGFYRYGFGNGVDVGLRIHNWVNLVGGLIDFRKSLGEESPTLKLATGVYSDKNHELVYLGPSLLFSSKRTYYGLKVNAAYTNDDMVFLDSGDPINTYYLAAGPSFVGGFQVGKAWKLLGGFEAGFYALQNGGIWPILQGELGLGYAF